jgi:formylglycine-generating enzyme required for sulfatase activity
MPRTTLRAVAAAAIVAGLLGGISLAQGAINRGAAVNARARNGNPSRDDFTPPGMVQIPAGPFLFATTPKEVPAIEKAFRMDSRQKARFRKRVNTELVDERRRSREVPPFYIDKWECTNLQYYFFRLATGAPAPALPADLHTRWRGGRLPGSTQLYFRDEVRSWPGLINRIRSGADKKSEMTPAGRIWSRLDAPLQKKLEKVKDPTKDLDEDLKDELVEALNQQVKARDFYSEDYFRGIRMPREVLRLKNKGLAKLSESDLTRFNRLLIDQALQSTVEKGQHPECMLMPVTGINWFQARACAAWMGKRLPTELEWEKAARGKDDARWYPWGDKFEQPDRCNWALFWVSPLNKDQKPQGLRPVGTFPKGVSVFGLYDMIGNAIEFTADPWMPHKHAVKDRSIVFHPIESPNLAVIKGGAYGEQFKENLRIPCRYGFYKSEATEAIGFRCAKDLDIGHTALAKIASDLFQGLWDQRLVKLDLERGLSCKERVTYDQEQPQHAIIKDYKWIGFVNIKDHLLDSEKSLKRASNKLRHKKDGIVFLGVFHTDLAFTNPPLKPGNYAIAYQTGFKALEQKAKRDKAEKKARKEKDKKSKDKKKKEKKKKKKKKKDRGKKKGKKEAKPAPEAGEDEKATEKEKPVAGPEAVPKFAAVPRILFLDASGKPIAAVSDFTVQPVRQEEKAKLRFYPSSEKTSAAAILHLAMLKKYEKKKFLTLDIPIYTKNESDLQGWRE